MLSKSITKKSSSSSKKSGSISYKHEENDSTSSSDSIEDELRNIQYIKYIKNDLREICFDDINKHFTSGKYGKFKIIIVKKNGYVNATDICKQAIGSTKSKECLNNWLESEDTIRLMETISKHTGLPINDLLCTITRGKN